jgi:hypothetical protein
MLPNPNTEIGKICMRKLVLHSGGNLSSDEVCKEMAYLMLEKECFDEYEPKIVPMMIQPWINYLNMPQEKKAKVPREFFDTPEIKSYLTARDKAHDHNRAMIGRFYDLVLPYIPQEDKPNREKCYRIINRFFDTEEANKHNSTIETIYTKTRDWEGVYEKD